ncbi:RNA methyltransferase [Eisenibacter elegans]|jgi:tRNA G18 (ribose-2'-O)-methylase SpoU|uniref:RNA methyltransferase n=1 Tax=Eisenibacter elegans TaxID=997 RepID=UPI00040C3C17|nr:RNA methyltransferase [Eisenibacter elegans]
MLRKLAIEEMNRLSPEAYQAVAKRPICLVLDNIRSLHNVGAAFRTADAFLAEKIYLCGITGTPPNREIHKTALGATESVAWEHHQDTPALLTKLKAQGYRILAIEQAEGSISLENYAFEATEKYAFVFGNEVAGVQDQVLPLCDACLEIPQWGTKHSLNVSVSVGIVLWQHSQGFLRHQH